MSCKCLMHCKNISVQLQLVITFKVSNSLDPDNAWTECWALKGSKLFAKGYQQMTMSCKCLRQSLKISVQHQLVITIKVSNSLDPDRRRQNVGPDLGPNCLQSLSADDMF